MLSSRSRYVDRFGRVLSVSDTFLGRVHSTRLFIYVLVQVRSIESAIVRVDAQF